MASRRSNNDSDRTPRRRPATTPEDRENQMIALAVDQAERQLEEGTASSQVITHYLKLGSSREKLEQERLMRENELLAVKKETLESAQRIEGLMTEALNAFRSYSPSTGGPAEIEEHYDD